MCVVSCTLVPKTVPKGKFVNILSSESITGFMYVISSKVNSEEFASANEFLVCFSKAQPH